MAELNLQQLQQKRERARKRKRAQAIHLAKPDPAPHAADAAATAAGESTQSQSLHDSWAEMEVLARSSSYQAAARQNPIIAAALARDVAASRATAAAKEHAPDAAQPANASEQPVARGGSVMSIRQIGERLKAHFLPAESPDPRAVSSAAAAEQEAVVCASDVQPDANPLSTSQPTLYQPHNRSSFDLHQPDTSLSSTTQAAVHQPFDRSSFDLHQPDANPAPVATLPAGTRMLNESDRLLLMQHPEQVIMNPEAVARAKMFAGPSVRPAVSAAFATTPAMLAEMAKDTDDLLQGHPQPHAERGSEKNAEKRAHPTHRAADPLAAQARAGAAQHDGDGAMHPQDQREDIAARDSTKSAAGSEHPATNPGQSNPENPESRTNPQNAPQLLENTDSRVQGATGAWETITHTPSQTQPSAVLPPPPARMHPVASAGHEKRHSDNPRAASDEPADLQGGQRGATEGGTATAAGGSENAAAPAVCATLATETDQADADVTENAAAAAFAHHAQNTTEYAASPDNADEPETGTNSKAYDGREAFKMFQVEFQPVAGSQLTSAGDDGLREIESPPCNGSGSEDDRAAEVAEYLKEVAGLEKRRAAPAPQNDATNPQHRQVNDPPEDSNALPNQSADEHPESAIAAEEKQAWTEDQANLSKHTTAVPNAVPDKTQQLAAVLAGPALHHSNHSNHAAAEEDHLTAQRDMLKSAQDHQARVPAGNPNVESKEFGHEEHEDTQNNEPEGTVAASQSKRKRARKPERNVVRVMRSGRKFQYL